MTIRVTEWLRNIDSLVRQKLAPNKSFLPPFLEFWLTMNPAQLIHVFPVDSLCLLDTTLLLELTG